MTVTETTNTYEFESPEEVQHDRHRRLLDRIVEDLSPILDLKVMNWKNGGDDPPRSGIEIDSRQSFKILGMNVPLGFYSSFLRINEDPSKYRVIMSELTYKPLVEERITRFANGKEVEYSQFYRF